MTTHRVGTPDHSGYICFLPVSPLQQGTYLITSSLSYTPISIYHFALIYENILLRRLTGLCLRVLKEFLTVRKNFTLKIQRSKDNCESKTNQVGFPYTGNADISIGKFSARVSIIGGIFASVMMVLSPFLEETFKAWLIWFNGSYRLGLFVVLNCEVLPLLRFLWIKVSLVSWENSLSPFQLILILVFNYMSYKWCFPFSINSSFQTDCYHEKHLCSRGEVWDEVHEMLKL